MQPQLSIFIFLSLTFYICKADIPVHCLAKDIAGTWVFYLDSSLQDTQKACGHMIPDRNTDHLNSRDLSKEESLDQMMELTLELPNHVKDSKGQLMGNWTMVYDEGFFVEISGFTFFAFSKYITKNPEPQDTDDEQSSGYLSQCGETLNGWYSLNGKWACYHGKKKNEPIGEGRFFDNSIVFKGVQGPKIVQRNVSDNMSLFDRFQNNLKLYEIPHDEFMNDNKTNDNDLFEPDLSFIQMVNSEKARLPWKASDSKSFRFKTKGQMKKLIGMTKFQQYKLKITQKTSKPAEKFQFSDDSFLQINFKSKTLFRKRSVHEPVRISNCIGKDEKGYPKCFDWRNVSGVNYDTPIKSQGDCGSCYAQAVLSAVESRIRIKSNNTLKPILSITNMISCSRYNQGCNGGYPWLVGKHGKEFGFAEASCQANTEADNKCDFSCLPKAFGGAEPRGRVWMVKDFGYIGKKFYGSTNEQAMMAELFKNGPIVIAFNAAPDLYYYSNGVFVTNPKEAFTQDNFRLDIADWEFTNHAVVCVGWGETDHEGQTLKYWIFKNSWGEDWGEGGYFRMLRGYDLGAVEHQSVFVDPIV